MGFIYLYGQGPVDSVSVHRVWSYKFWVIMEEI